MIPPAPSETRERLPARVLGWVRGRPAWVGIILLVVGSVMVAQRLGVWHPTVFWGVTLVVVGIALFRDDRAWRDGSGVSVPERETLVPRPSEVPAPQGEMVAAAPPDQASLAPPSMPVRSYRPHGWTPRWPFRPH